MVNPLSVANVIDLGHRILMGTSREVATFTIYRESDRTLVSKDAAYHFSTKYPVDVVKEQP